MGPLMSDITLIDAMLDETLRLLDGLSELAYTPDSTCAGYEHKAEDPREWPRLTSRSAALATDADP
jgi:hypothetical protein